MANKKGKVIPLCQTPNTETQEQSRRALDAYSLFLELAEINNGKVEDLEFHPATKTYGITAYFKLLYVGKGYLERLSSVVSYMSALSIDSLKDGTVCISCTIPHENKG